MKKWLGLLTVVTFVFIGATAFGAVVVLNDRDPQIPYGPSADGINLFDPSVLGGAANPTQLPYDYFIPVITAGPLSYHSEFSLRFEITGHAPGDKMSIYSINDPTKELVVFPGSATPGAGVTVNFIYNPGTLLWDLAAYNSGGTFDTESFSGLGFGFVLEYTGTTDTWATNGQKFYGDDELNPNNNAQMLVFNSFVPGTFYFAFEDTSISNNLWNAGSGPPYTDRDYQDFIFSAQSINPVPEPGTMMLLGSGLVGLAGWGRKKFRK